MNSTFSGFFDKEANHRLFMELPSGLTDWIQVVPKPGIYQSPKYGRVQITTDDHHQFVENFQKRVYQEHIPIDAEHATKLTGALAYYREMKVGHEGRPGVFARLELTGRGKDLLDKGGFKYFSPEMFASWQDPATQRTYRNVLTGGAFTTKPFFKDSAMEPVRFSEEFEFCEGMHNGAEDMLHVVSEMLEEGHSEEDIREAIDLAIEFAAKTQSPRKEFMQEIMAKVAPMMASDQPDVSDVHMDSVIGAKKRRTEEDEDDEEDEDEEDSEPTDEKEPAEEEEDSKGKPKQYADMGGLIRKFLRKGDGGRKGDSGSKDNGWHTAASRPTVKDAYVPDPDETAGTTVYKAAPSSLTKDDPDYAAHYDIDPDSNIAQRVGVPQSRRQSDEDKSANKAAAGKTTAQNLQKGGGTTAQNVAAGKPSKAEAAAAKTPGIGSYRTPRQEEELKAAAIPGYSGTQNTNHFDSDIYEPVTAKGETYLQKKSLGGSVVGISKGVTGGNTPESGKSGDRIRSGLSGDEGDVSNDEIVMLPGGASTRGRNLRKIGGNASDLVNKYNESLDFDSILRQFRAVAVAHPKYGTVYVSESEFSGGKGDKPAQSPRKETPEEAGHGGTGVIGGVTKKYDAIEDQWKPSAQFDAQYPSGKGNKPALPGHAQPQGGIGGNEGAYQEGLTEYRKGGTNLAYEWEPRPADKIEGRTYPSENKKSSVAQSTPWVKSNPQATSHVWDQGDMGDDDVVTTPGGGVTTGKNLKKIIGKPTGKEGGNYQTQATMTQEEAEDYHKRAGLPPPQEIYRNDYGASWEAEQKQKKKPVGSEATTLVNKYSEALDFDAVMKDFKKFADEETETPATGTTTSGLLERLSGVLGKWQKARWTQSKPAGKAERLTGYKSYYAQRQQAEHKRKLGQQGTRIVKHSGIIIPGSQPYRTDPNETGGPNPRFSGIDDSPEGVANRKAAEDRAAKANPPPAAAVGTPVTPNPPATPVKPPGLKPVAVIPGTASDKVTPAPIPVDPDTGETFPTGKPLKPGQTVDEFGNRFTPLPAGTSARTAFSEVLHDYGKLWKFAASDVVSPTAPEDYRKKLRDQNRAALQTAIGNRNLSRQVVATVARPDQTPDERAAANDVTSTAQTKVIFDLATAGKQYEDPENTTAGRAKIEAEAPGKAASKGTYWEGFTSPEDFESKVYVSGKAHSYDKDYDRLNKKYQTGAWDVNNPPPGAYMAKTPQGIIPMNAQNVRGQEHRKDPVLNAPPELSEEEKKNRANWTNEAGQTIRMDYGRSGQAKNSSYPDQRPR